jgi:hypothetical protein
VIGYFQLSKLIEKAEVKHLIAHVIDSLYDSSFYFVLIASGVSYFLINEEKAVEKQMMALFQSESRDGGPLKTHQSSIAPPLNYVAKGDEDHGFL